MEEKLTDVKQLSFQEAMEELRNFDIESGFEAPQVLDFLKKILTLEPVEEHEILHLIEELSGGFRNRPKFTVGILRKQLKKYREEYNKQKSEANEEKKKEIKEGDLA